MSQHTVEHHDPMQPVIHSQLKALLLRSGEQCEASWLAAELRRVGINLTGQTMVTHLVALMIDGHVTCDSNNRWSMTAKWRDA